MTVQLVVAPSAVQQAADARQQYCHKIVEVANTRAGS